MANCPDLLYETVYLEVNAQKPDLDVIWLPSKVGPAALTHFLTMVETQRVWRLTVNMYSRQIFHQNTDWWALCGGRSGEDTCEGRMAEAPTGSSPVNSSLLFPAYETTPSRPHLALFTCLFLLMSFLGVAMYCTDRRHQQRLCDELEAVLAVYLLHVKQLLWGCWIWLTMQWRNTTTGGVEEPALQFSRPLLFFLFWKDSRPTNTAHCLQCWSTLRVKKENNM